MCWFIWRTLGRVRRDGTDSLVNNRPAERERKREESERERKERRGER
jgi:hypothetical protein